MEYFSFGYSYLIGDLTLLIIWGVLFWWRSDIRREMLAMSFLFGVAGLASQLVLRRDWWTPLTITNTPLGLEDFLFGACFGGIAAVAYEVFFKRKVKLRRFTRASHYDRYVLVSLVLASAALFLGLTLARFSSFESACVALVAPALFMLYIRKDLIVDALVSGILAVCAQWMAFLVVEWVTPGWVAQFWLHDQLSGVVILYAPLEDIIWAFCAGLFIGPLYEFWKEGRLTRLSK